MFKLGADPELFLKDASEAYISAIGLIGGSKDQPRPLEIGPGYAVQEDNVALEYNIPPAANRVEFDGNIDKVMKFLSQEVNKLGLHFATDSAVSFPKEQLLHPAAMTFGCDPDFNAWKNGKRNPRPKTDDHTLRTCGGHVHIGYEFKGTDDINEFIKYVDLYTVGSVIMDKGERRKQLYGSAGCVRYKSYGCEYRSLSNFWIFKPELRQWVWDSVAMAMDAWQSKKFDVNTERATILNAINKNNKDAAKHLVEKYNLLMV
jgi:hypothetical protein